MFRSHRPPSLLEIFSLPVAGAFLIEAIHTRKNDLQLLAIPIFIVLVRLFLAQFEVPPVNLVDADLVMRRARARCIAYNQSAVVVLFLFEEWVVLASTAIEGLEGPLLSLVVLTPYILLRLWSRRYWFMASGQNTTP